MPQHRFRETRKILELMDKKERIRNVGIIAHIDHGKTTMTDSLLQHFLGPKIRRWLDYLKEEQERGITIKTANISIVHREDDQAFLVNLIDTPGHVDFTGKVTRALRAIDGAIVVVDAVEEVMVQTETVTRQALNERVKPVLFINKVDRLIKELRLSANEIELKLDHIIRNFNNLIALYGEAEQQKHWKVDPAQGTVAFGSALDRWGFTIDIAKKQGVKFNDLIETYKQSRVEELATNLPLHNAILSMVVQHLPNAVEAQRQRIQKIWKGDIDSEIGRAMLSCDSEGPTTMCITSTQIDRHAGLVVTGRLFSGTIREGDQVHLVGARRDYRVPQVSLYMGPFREPVNQIDAGNVTALLGLDQARPGETLISIDHREEMIPFERIKYVSEPVVTIALEPKHPKDLPHLTDIMRRLTIEDPNLVTSTNKETGEYLLSGMGELHLEIAVKFLREYSGGKLEIITSKPLVVYRESTLSPGVIAMTKSPNKHNRFWIQVEPLEEKVVQLIEKGDLAEEMGRKKIGAVLKEAGWSTKEARNVWAMEEHRNVLVDLTKGVQYLREVRDMMVSGFRWACQNGPLCEEPMRGIKVKITDVLLHEDPAHRGPAQIMPAVRHGILGSFLSSHPVMLEPVYKIGVRVPAQYVGEVSRLITKRRGRIVASEQRGSLTMVTGFIPVAEAFGLSAGMRHATSGHAFWQCTFDHWEKTPENVAVEVIRATRERRGLPLEVPTASRFLEET